MTTELVELSITEALAGLDKKEFSAVELTKAHLAEMEKAKGLNAYITETPELAVALAEKSDVRRKKHEKTGAMDGIPLGIKDLYCTKHVLTTAASRILSNFRPPYESTVTHKLFAAGAVMTGKTNLDEFAMGTANLTSHYGAVRNPYSRKDDEFLVPGGSSGGSAAAVAAGLCMAATGSDTGGSIRTPASFCNLVGMKPTYGRCSRYGMVAFSSSLDQAGTMTRTVKDTALMLKVISGFDPKDSTSVQKDVPEFDTLLNGHVKGMKIGIPKEYRSDALSVEVARWWDRAATWLKDAGAEVIDVSLPHTMEALPAYYIIAPSEASTNLGRYDGVRFGVREPGDTLDKMFINTRTKGFGKEVKRRIMLGTFLLSEENYTNSFLKAQKVRRLICKDFSDVFTKVDALLAPSAPETAFDRSASATADPIKMGLYDVFTGPASLAGLPTLSVPAGFSSDGLPVGLQIIGNSFEEEKILNIAQFIEKAAGLNLKPRRVKA